jgi:hypothetical protein
MKPLAIPLCTLFSAPVLIAQTLLLGNPQITPGLQGEGYVIQASKSQTATTSSVTYTVTAPSNATPASVTVGKLNVQFVPPPNVFSTTATLTITFSGGMAVTGAGNSLFFQGAILHPEPANRYGQTLFRSGRP